MITTEDSVPDYKSLMKDTFFGVGTKGVDFVGDWLIFILKARCLLSLRIS